MTYRKNSGFTLLELGLVLVVLSLLVSGFLSVATQNIRLAKKKELEMKLDAIEDAVISFRKANGYIPCPGDLALADSNANFGFQAQTVGINICTTGTPAATFNDGSNTVAGMVPVRTLGLPDDYARDPWNGKFLYVVDKRATDASTFSVAKLNDTSLIGSITVKDSGNFNITTTAVLAVVSFGQNGHGAYVGTARKYVGSTNAAEWENCACDASSVGTFDSEFYSYINAGASATGLDTYDDAVRFYNRSQLVSDTDTKTEK